MGPNGGNKYYVWIRVRFICKNVKKTIKSYLFEQTLGPIISWVTAAVERNPTSTNGSTSHLISMAAIGKGKMKCNLPSLDRFVCQAGSTLASFEAATPSYIFIKLNNKLLNIAHTYRIRLERYEAGARDIGYA